jgi:gliding motility-associated-like protein
MKRKSTVVRMIMVIMLFLVLPQAGFSQLTTTNSTPYNNADSLVKNVLLGSGVRVFNIRYNTGPGDSAFVDNGIGYFNNTASTTLGIGIDEGIIMSSGNIADAVGPNLTGSRSSQLNGNRSDPDLATLTNANIRDASVLEFDFIPSSDSVSFTFVFGSDEYPEYAGSNYNDPFGFFISGPGISGTYSDSAINIAKLPGTNTEITINTVNAGVNSAYYIVNGTGNNGAGNAIDNPDVQFDGFTIPIEVFAFVIPCDTYHIKLAVADVADRTRNSAVFLRAKSFSSSGVSLSVINEYAPFYGDSVLFEGCDSNTFSFSRLNGFGNSEKLFLSTHGVANALDYSGVPDSIVFAANDTTVSFTVHAIQDFISDPDESFIITLLPDTASCLLSDSAVFNLVIREPEPLISITQDTQLQCIQPDSVMIGIGMVAGQQPYSFQWATGQTSDTIMALSPMNDTLIYITVYNGCFSDSLTDSVHIFSSEYDTSFYHTIADTFTVFCNSNSLAMNVSMDSGNTEFMIRWHGSPPVYDSTLVLTPPYFEGYYGYTIMDMCNGVVIDSLHDSVYVKLNRPTAAFTWDNSCENEVLKTQDSSYAFYGAPIANQFWDFNNDGFYEQNGPIATHIYQDTGSYIVHLAVQDSTGCFDTISKTIVNFPKPVAAFNHVNACVFDSISFTDQSTVVNVSGVLSSVNSWLWLFGDGDSSTSQNPTHAFDTAGSQQVTLLIETDKGCVDTVTNSSPIVSYPLPDVSFSNINACFLDSNSFSDQTTIPSVSGLSFTKTAWKWEFGNGDTANTANAQYAFPSPGDYVVTLTVWSNQGCADSAVNTTLVRSYELPNPDFSAANLCMTTATEFTDLSTSIDGSINAWKWNFLNNDTSNLQNPSYIFNIHDTFSVSLVTTTDLGCRDSITKNVVINDLPNPYFSYNTICQDDSVTVQQMAVSGITGQPIVSYYWDLDNDGATDDTDTIAKYSFGSVVGLYPVELRVTDSLGCTDSITRQIFVNPNPVVEFTSTNVCLGAPINFFDQSSVQFGNLTDWSWAFGVGTDSSSLQNPGYLYTNPGSYPVFLEVTSDSGCVSNVNDSVAVIVNPLPETNFSISNSCLVDSVKITDNSTILFGDITKWIWYYGNGQTDTVNAPETNGSIDYVYPNYGNYNVVLAAISDSGCAVQDTQSVAIFEMPVAEIDLNKSCLFDLAQFNDSSTVATDSITAWLWEMGDGSTYTSRHPSHTFNTSDTFLVNLKVTTSNGCSDSTVAVDTVLSLPNAQFFTANICQKDTLQLLNQSASINGFGLTQFAWDIDNDGVSDYSSLNASHHYSIHDSVFVELRVEDAFGCADSTQKHVFIHPEPIAAFALDNTCQFQDASFANQTTLDYGSVISYDYSFGDGQFSSTVNPNHAYANFGTFGVQLNVITDSGCVDSIMQTIVIHEKPAADFAVIDRCLNDSSQFNDQSTISSGAISNWNWAFGDGTASSQVSPAKLYAQDGTYQVQLIVESDSACFDTISKTHVIHDLPLVQFNLNNVCPGDLLTLQDASSAQNPFSINQWFWDVDTNGSIDHNSASTQHLFLFPGTGFHEVELRVEDTYGCTDSLTKSMKVHPQPNAIIASVNACLNDQVAVYDSSVVDTSNIVNWVWDMGTGDTLYNQNNNYLYTTFGTKTITLIVTSNDQCRDTTSSNVRVYELPTANFEFQDTCEYEQLLVTSTSSEGDTTISVYEWHFGDLSASQFGTSQLHTYATNAIYPVLLTVTDRFGCENDTTQNVEIFEQPDVAFHFEEVCDKDSVFFVDQTSYDSASLYNTARWEWDFDDGTNGLALGDTNHLYASAGFYDVELTVFSDKGCVASLIKNVEVHPLPKPQFSFNDTCANKPLAFLDESTIAWDALASWRWDFGDSIKSIKHPINHFDTGGLHDVKLTVRSDFGCIDSINKVVDVMYVPVTAYDVNMTESCSPAQFQFENTTPSIPNNTLTYKWMLGENLVSENKSLTRTISNNGRVVNEYDFELIAETDEGCLASFTLPTTLRVFPLPVAGFYADPEETTTYEGLVNFVDTSRDASDWLWDFGVDNMFGFSSTESFDYADFYGDRTVKLIVTNIYDCIDSTSRDIYIEPQSEVFAPNAFTPDGDLLNDTFSPKYNDIESVSSFKIFNRWGELIYEGIGKEASWDGNINGYEAPIGTYLFEVQYIDGIGRFGFKTGQVNILR